MRTTVLAPVLNDQPSLQFQDLTRSTFAVPQTMICSVGSRLKVGIRFGGYQAVVDVSIAGTGYQTSRLGTQSPCFSASSQRFPLPD